MAITMNPGLSGFFPQLSRKAQAYDQYRWTGFGLAYTPVYGEITAGSVGIVAFAVERNLSVPPPTSIESMSRMEGYMGVKANESAMWMVECDPTSWSRDYWYVRNDGTSGTSSVVTAAELDAGVVYIGVQCGSSVAANDLLGYVRALTNVCVTRNTVSTYLAGYYHSRPNSYTNAGPLGTGGTETVGTSGVATGVLAGVTRTGTTLSFTGVPNGTALRISIRWAGTGAVVVAYPSVSAPSFTALNVQAGGSSANETAPLAGVTATACSMQLTYQLACAFNAVGVITFGTGTLPTTAQGVEIFIESISLTPVLGTSI